MKEEDSLKGLVSIIKQRLAMIFSFGILGLILTATYTFFIVTPMYESTTQLLVNRASGDVGNGIQLNDISSNVQMINTYKDIIKGPVILSEVKEQLQLDYTIEQLAEMVEIGANEDSLVFSLTIRGPKADETAEIANEIAATFQTELVEIMNVENVSIISIATINSEPISPIILNNLLIGLLLGLLAGTGIAFLRSSMDRTIDDYQFVTQTIGWPNLGAISELNKEEYAAVVENSKEKKTQKKDSEEYGNSEVQERIHPENRVQKEAALFFPPEKESEKLKKKTHSNHLTNSERLVTVSDRTREKIETILQNETVKTVGMKRERRE